MPLTLAKHLVEAATRVMNPTFPQRTIDRAMEKDPADASAEYGAEFRSDLVKLHRP
jgi:hypothetical protein